MKKQPESSRLRLCLPENMALKSEGEGALRSVVMLVVNFWPPTLSTTCGHGVAMQARVSCKPCKRARPWECWVMLVVGSPAEPHGAGCAF